MWIRAFSASAATGELDGLQQQRPPPSPPPIHETDNFLGGGGGAGGLPSHPLPRSRGSVAPRTSPRKPGGVAAPFGPVRI